MNAVTVDVEDWFHVCGLAGEPVVASTEWRLRANVDKLLALLAEEQVRATFFVLGWVADNVPGLVRQIALAGHEIASHGYSHRLVGQLDPSRFRDEIRRTGDILERQAGTRPAGFRAPQWSLSLETPWPFDILYEEGYCYDSSCTPLRFIGNPHGRSTPYRLKTAAGSLWEIPPMVTPSLLGNLPTGGGWGLRLFPRRVIENTIRDLNAAGTPAVIYLHPRDFDPAGPRLELSPLRSFAAYGPRTDVTQRLAHLLRRFRFGTLRTLVEQWESA
jgi:polysaccharide deacetylase family protein (PEP-CTERM system associated)